MDAEIRQAIETICRVAEYWARSTEAGTDDENVTLDAVVRARAWLAAQPAQWVPVEDGDIELDADRAYATLRFCVDGTIDYLGETEFPSFDLPDNLRLCRKEP